MAATITLYGIPNCDTVKKARRWLDAEGIDYTFHDYKKSGIDATKLSSWIKTHGIDTIVNKRGTTWRKLEESKREGLNDAKAVKLLLEHNSMIKRPILENGKTSLVGFDQKRYLETLK